MKCQDHFLGVLEGPVRQPAHRNTSLTQTAAGETWPVARSLTNDLHYHILLDENDIRRKTKWIPSKQTMHA